MCRAPYPYPGGGTPNEVVTGFFSAVGLPDSTLGRRRCCWNRRTADLDQRAAPAIVPEPELLRGREPHPAPPVRVAYLEHASGLGRYRVRSTAGLRRLRP